VLDSSQGGGAAGGMMPDALRYDRGGKAEDDTDEEVRKRILKNLQGSSKEDLSRVVNGLDEQQFLMKHMPNYAAAMSPSLSGMVEGAQFGDRMAKSYGGSPRDVNIQPMIRDANNYGGIASIGHQLDPDTRLNLMANVQRSPYDRNTLDAVRRIGGGVSHQIDKDKTLSAFYEQDPMGRDKSGGVRYTQNFVQGGQAGYNLGGYSDGGRLLKGPGDGMSDNIPASIGNRQPARLADGEFVVPADVVSHLGNGSTDAGAKKLYAMMDKVRQARTGNKQQGKQIKAEKYLKT
jgi:hypothetical protein